MGLLHGKLKLLLCAAAGIILCIGGWYLLYVNGYLLPGWIIWQEKEIVIPGNPGHLTGTLVLKNRRILYQRDGETVWQSDPAWKISDMEVCDLDHDGWPEALALSWTQGDYGDYHPIYENPNMFFYTQRFYVFDLEETALKPQFMSSRLRPEAHAWQVSDTGEVSLTDKAGKTTVWVWKSWGMKIKE